MSASRLALFFAPLLAACLGTYEPLGAGETEGQTDTEAEGDSICADFDLICEDDERCTLTDDDMDGLATALACIPSSGSVPVGGQCNHEADTFEDDCLAPDTCFVYETFAPFGVCAPLCTGQGDCPLGDQDCIRAEDAPAGHCVITCDPLADACGDFHDCYPFSFDGNVRFACLPRVVDDSELYRNCSRQVDCGPGMACIGADAFGEGQCDAANCCAPYCSTSMGADPCPEAGTCESLANVGWPSEDTDPGSGLCLWP